MVRKIAAAILHTHVTFELEDVDRNVSQCLSPVAADWGRRGRLPEGRARSDVPTAMVAPMSQQLVGAIERFRRDAGLDLVTFEKGQRKHDIAHQYLEAFDGEEGILFVGKAQEKASVFRTESGATHRGSATPGSSDRPRW
jgi:hypothetical protein